MHLSWTVEVQIQSLLLTSLMTLGLHNFFWSVSSFMKQVHILRVNSSHLRRRASVTQPVMGKCCCSPIQEQVTLETMSPRGAQALWYGPQWETRGRGLGRAAGTGKWLRLFQMTSDGARDPGFPLPQVRSCQDESSAGSLAVRAVWD